MSFSSFNGRQFKFFTRLVTIDLSNDVLHTNEKLIFTGIIESSGNLTVTKAWFHQHKRDFQLTIIT